MENDKNPILLLLNSPMKRIMIERNYQMQIDMEIWVEVIRDSNG